MAPLDNVQAAIALLDSWHANLGGSREDRLNFSALNVTATVADFDLEHLYQFSDAGSSASLTITAGEFRATIELRDKRRFNADVESDAYEDAFVGTDLQEARRAVDSNAIEEFLRLSAPLDCRARLVVETGPGQVDVGWVRTEDAFLKDSEDQGWWHFAVTISGRGRGPVVVILDSGTNFVRCHGITARGPDAATAAPSAMSERSSWEAYRRAWFTDERSELPPPLVVRPVDNVGLIRISRRLEELSCALSWAWLAQWSKPAAKGAKLGFEGRPPVEIDMTAWPGAEGSSEIVNLITWVVQGADLTRRDAVGQALLAAVSDATALLSSARRTLETARLLMRQSQQSLLAEALRARRDAMGAARDAAYKGADAVRSATKAATDRAFTELAAAAGIVLANLTSTLKPDLAHALLILVLMLVVATAAVAYLYDFRSAQDYLGTLNADLDLYADSITGADLERVKSMGALTTARSELRHAKVFVGLTLLLLTVAILVSLAVVH